MISNANSTGSSSTSPERTNLDPSGNGFDIGADRQLFDYDSDSPDELNKEISSQTFEGNFDLYATSYGSLSTFPEFKSGSQ